MGLWGELPPSLPPPGYRSRVARENAADSSSLVLGANSKPMVGVQPFALEKEDGEVRKVFVAWLFIGRAWEAGLDGHWKEALEEFARGKLGSIVRAWGLGSEMVLSEQTPNHLSPGGRSKTGCTGPTHKPTRAEAAPCSGVTGTLV